MKLQIPSEWTDTERWVWEKIQGGRNADFNKRYLKENQVLDPKDSNGWDDEKNNRYLSAAFLETILTNKKFQSEIPFRGVCISGAYIQETVDLQHANIESQLRLERCRIQNHFILANLYMNSGFSMIGSWFGGVTNLNGAVLDRGAKFSGAVFEKAVDMQSVSINLHLSMIGCIFLERLSMSGAQVSHCIFMRERAFFQEIDMTGAKIGGQIDMRGSTFNGNVCLNSAEIGQSLLMRENARFREISLQNAKISGQIDLRNSYVDGELDMNGAVIGEHLLMSHRALFTRVNLSGVKISGQVAMDESVVTEELVMGGIKIGENFFARATKFPTDKEVIIHFANIGDSLDLSGSFIKSLDLTGTDIGCELRLGSGKHPPTQWQSPSRLVLRNTSVGAIQDADINIDCWPETMVREGFVYKNLGGYGAMGEADIVKRKSKWFINWLERDESFSPQPNEQLAKVLHKSGYPSKANDILFAARKRTRKIALTKQPGKPRDIKKWIGMCMLESAIGYGLGIRYFRVLWWFLGLTLIGFGVLLLELEPVKQDAFKMLSASLDNILPIVTLNNELGKYIFNNVGNYAVAFFYIQKMIGYVLGGFLAAGLAGLTQKANN